VSASVRVGVDDVLTCVSRFPRRAGDVLLGGGEITGAFGSLAWPVQIAR